MRVFLDANVLFSASCRASRISRLVERLVSHPSVHSSDYAYEEALRNIRLKRPSWEGDLHGLRSKIGLITSIDRPVPCEIVPKDRPIIATAIKARCEYLVTGDIRDFGHLFNHAILGVTVVSPLRMAEILQQGHSR